MQKLSLFLHVCEKTQLLNVIDNNKITKSYFISTGKNGLGEIKNTGCTPRGWHQIRAKIGNHCPLNSVFKARRFTGEVFDDELRRNYPKCDWILTRILWLDGLEAGKNRYGNVHTASRYIYIHGTPDDLIDGIAKSHGCIRMKNADVLELFNNVCVGTRVFID